MNVFSEECEIVERLRIKNEAMLRELVKMHLLFVLDLNDDNYEVLFQPECQRNEKSKHLSGSKKVKSDDGIFRCSLTEEGICRLYVLIDFIIQDINIVQEGIFRKCGSAVRQQELKYKLSHGSDVDLKCGDYTVHDCANVLKACLAELPEPLLTDSHFKLQCLVSDVISPSVSPSKQEIADKKRLRILQLLILLLPINVRKFVQNLILLLHKVTLNCDQNKMDSRSLATLFCPHLLFPKNMSAQDMQKYSGVLSDELQFVIDNVDQLFQPPKELVSDILIELKKCQDDKTTKDDVVTTAYTFCERNVGDKNLTEIELAVLYSQLHNMPNNALKHKLMKQFNRQNGGVSPIAVKKSTPGKRVIKGIGNQLRRVGHNLFSRSPKAKHKKMDASEEDDACNNDSEGDEDEPKTGDTPDNESEVNESSEKCKIIESGENSSNPIQIVNEKPVFV